MNPPVRYERRAGARDLHWFAHPELWPYRPFLPVTRQAVGSDARQCGLLYDARGVSGRYGFACTVYLVNVYRLPATEAELLAQPRCVYDTFEQLAADGWSLD
jgi:hypothetical protein